MIWKNTIKKYILVSILISFIFILSASSVWANDTSSVVLLEDYGGLSGDINKAISEGDSSKALAAYINVIVKIAIGFGSIGAVILLVWGGIEYITAQSFTSKSGGKDRVQRALGSLAILFTAFILFGQLNPELLKVRFNPISPNIGVQQDLSSLVFGSDDDDKIVVNATKGFIKASQTCSSDKQSCDLKKKLFIEANREDINRDKIIVSPNCLKDTKFINQYCAYYVNKDIYDNNTSLLALFNEKKKEAESKGYKKKRSQYNASKESAKITCDSTITLASYYNECHCRKKAFGTEAHWSCSNFYKADDVISLELLKAQAKPETGNFITRSGAFVWNKQECQSAKSSDSLALNSFDCMLEAKGRLEYGYFRKK